MKDFYSKVSCATLSSLIAFVLSYIKAISKQGMSFSRKPHRQENEGENSALTSVDRN